MSLKGRIILTQFSKKVKLLKKLYDLFVKYFSVPYFGFIQGHSYLTNDNLKELNLNKEEKTKKTNFNNPILKSLLSTSVKVTPEIFPKIDKCIKTVFNKLELDVVGTMCLPPVDDQSDNYFSKMQSINESLNLKEISMGMSNDYLKAIKFKSTFLRIGTMIFGQRF